MRTPMQVARTVYRRYVPWKFVLSFFGLAMPICILGVTVGMAAEYIVWFCEWLMGVMERAMRWAERRVVEEPVDLKVIKAGDYVLATKYADGDLGDHWAVGFVAGMTSHDEPRYLVADETGKLFRANGFRRVAKITPEQGDWFLRNARTIEQSARSVWEYLQLNDWQHINQLSRNNLREHEEAGAEKGSTRSGA